MSDRRKEPKPQIAWGMYNLGRLWGIRRTKSEAIREIGYRCGKPWKECKSYIEVHKVLVSKVKP